LPTDKAYTGSNPRLALVYERSWLACRYVAAHYGEQALVRLYRRVGARTHGTERSAVDAAMHAVLHTSLAAFTRDWRSYVLAQLG
jgi:hypothetical protein